MKSSLCLAYPAAERPRPQDACNTFKFGRQFLDLIESFLHFLRGHLLTACLLAEPVQLVLNVSVECFYLLPVGL